MPLDKPAEAEHDIHPLIRARWSPRSFSDRAVSDEQLGSLFEAARWAPSSGNAQPWSFVYALREGGGAFRAMFDCLKPGNQKWAGEAAALIATVAQLDFVHPDKPDRPNRHAYHDVGLATAQLMLQATSMGLVVHAMAGFDRDAARATLRIPDGHDVVAFLAVGYQGEVDDLADDKLRSRERAPRTRRPVAKLAFRGTWGG